MKLTSVLVKVLPYKVTRKPVKFSYTKFGGNRQYQQVKKKGIRKIMDHGSINGC